MQINATFLVQIVNFWISYAMLHKFFFKPFVRFIEKKSTAKRTLLENLKAKELSLAQLQEDKKRHLEDFRAHLKAQYQPPIPTLEKIPTPPTFIKDSAEIAAITKTATEILIEKAPHAY